MAFSGVKGGGSRKSPRGGILAGAAMKMADRMAGPFKAAQSWASTGWGGQQFNKYFGMGRGSVFQQNIAHEVAQGRAAGLTRGQRAVANPGIRAQAASMLARRRVVGGAIGAVGGLYAMGAAGGPIDLAITGAGGMAGYGLLAGARGGKVRGGIGAMIGAGVARWATGAG